MIAIKTTSLAAAAVVVASTLAACGSPAPSATTSADTKISAKAQDGLDAVLKQVSGLTGKAREKKLISMAEKEGGSVTLYTSQGTDDIQPVVDAFSDATGIDVDLYRAEPDTVDTRIQQEVGAGVQGGDVALIDSTAMLPADKAGDLLNTSDDPINSQIRNDSASDNWIAVSYNAYLPMWNTKEVTGADVPKTWEDVLTKYGSHLGVDPSDDDWFMALVTEYFEKQKGMTEDQAVQLFKDGMKNVKTINGHSTGVELLSAGDIWVHAAQNWSQVADLGDAPVGYQPIVQPMVLRSSGLGVIATTTKPAAAALLYEWLLTDGQSLWVKQGLFPSNTNTPGGSVLQNTKTIDVDVAQLASETDKWEKLFASVTGEPG